MKFDTIKFLKDYSIPRTTDHHHCSEGSVNIHCPFCNDNNFKLGMYLVGGEGNCWACGQHSVIDIIRNLLRCSAGKAHTLRDQYTDVLVAPSLEDIIEEKVDEVTLPLGTRSMTAIHKNYLKRRKFDPDKLEVEWELKGTEIHGEYGMRIIIPIYYNNHLISYQGRDVTDKSSLRYLFCHKNKEAFPSKEILYGIDKTKGMSKIIVVEGATDVWRLGPGAVATFGLSYTIAQLNLMKRFRQVYIWFDEGGEKSAVQLSEVLGLVTNVELLRYTDKSDPADIPQEEADSMMKELIHS